MEKEFDYEVEKLGLFVNQLQYFYHREIEEDGPEVDGKKLGIIELQFLELFEYQLSIKVKEAVKLLKIPNSTATSVINRLEDMKIVTRQISHEDRRVFEIILTPRGTHIVNQRKSQKVRLYKYLLTKISNKDKSRLLKVIESLSESMFSIEEEEIRRFQMDLLKKEYDEFGPWINKITEADDVPPQFDREKDRIMASNYAVKIPRNIARSNVRPGDPMYDYVLALYDDSLLHMTRKGTVISTVAIDYKDIQLIEKVNDLLSGNLNVVAGDNDYRIPYSTVSGEIIDEMLGEIRAKYYLKEAVLDLDSFKNIEVDTLLYKNMLSKDQEEEKLKVLAYQPFIELIHKETSKFEFKHDLYNKPVLHDSVFAFNGKELIIITRVKDVKELNEADYGYKYTYIPVEYIKEVSSSEDPQIGRLINLEIVVGNVKRIFHIGPDFDLAVLKGLIQ